MEPPGVASSRGVPTAREAADALRTALARDDEDRAYAVALEVRDQLRANLPRTRALDAAWATCPAGLEERWLTLLAVLACHEFERAGVPAPGWTTTQRLEMAWVLDTPRLSAAEVRAQTPAWLADRNIFIAAKDLGTL